MKQKLKPNKVKFLLTSVFLTALIIFLSSCDVVEEWAENNFRNSHIFVTQNLNNNINKKDTTRKIVYTPKVVYDCPDSITITDEINQLYGSDTITDKIVHETEVNNDTSDLNYNLLGKSINMVLMLICYYQ